MEGQTTTRAPAPRAAIATRRARMRPHRATPVEFAVLKLLEVMSTGYRGLRPSSGRIAGDT